MSGNVVRPSAFNRIDEVEVAESNSGSGDISGFKDLSWEKDVQIVKLRATEAALEVELDEKERQLAELHSLHAKEQSEVGRLQGILDSHDANIESVKLEFNRRLAKISDQTWAKDIEIKTLVSDLDETRQRLRATEAQRLEFETRSQMAAVQLADGSRELARTREHISTIEHAAKVHTDALQKETAALKSAHVEQVNQLNSTIADSQMQLHKLEVERERLLAEMKKQMVEAKTLRERAEKLQAEIDLRNSSRTFELSRTAEEYSLSIAKLVEQHNHEIQRLQNLSANEKQDLIDRAARQLKQAQDESASQIANLKHMCETALTGAKDAEAKFTIQINRLREQSIAQMQAIEELGLKNHELQRSMLSETSARASLSEELTRKRELLSKLVEEIEGLRTSKAAIAKELAEDRIQKDAAIQKVTHLTTSMRMAQDSIAELEANLSQSSEKLLIQTKCLAESERDRAAALHEIEVLTKRIQDQAATLEAVTAEASKVRETLAEEQNLHRLEMVSVRREADESAGKISELQIRIRSVEFELKSARDKFTVRNAEFENERAALGDRILTLNSQSAKREAELRLEIEALGAAMKAARDGFTQQRDESEAKFAVEAASMKTELRNISAGYETKIETLTREMAAKMRDFNAEKSKMESRLQFSAESISNLECRIVALNNQSVEQSARHSDTESKLKIELDQTRTSLRMAREQSEKAREAKLESAKKAKADADSAMAKLGESYQQRIDKDEREIATLRKKLAEQGAQIESSERINESRSAEVAQREEQLRQYANFVTDQKAELVRQTRKLAEEIEMTGRMHPLRDYLEVTEFELSKIEVRLKVTPTLSMDRPRLEAQIVQLTEQRTFLRSVIEASSKRLAEQAAGILALVNSPSLGATPPIPPQIKSANESSAKVPAPAVIAPMKKSFDVGPNS
jgi:chromosome segregation ATPase